MEFAKYFERMLKKRDLSNKQAMKKHRRNFVWVAWTTQLVQVSL